MRNERGGVGDLSLEELDRRQSGTEGRKHQSGRAHERWRDAVLFVKPETILRWHRAGFGEQRLHRVLGSPSSYATPRRSPPGRGS